MFLLNSKYYFIYIASYFLLSFLSIAVNKIFGLQPGVAPNIFVQIVCVIFIVKKLSQNKVLSIREKAFLPILFSCIAVIFFLVMLLVFPEWREEHRSPTLFSIIIIFIFNYVVGLIATLYIPKTHKADH